ncbi:uncharacterized protein TrAFT101_007074 [Trichoderma asperellum]|uniref:uncharacterized protein n=1 Tax=Trichoderma asperellum TaxID=101201 RepID=UPI003326F39B|nr:hypothetical protein TrAFT101_007074 [Trichoderma asperellum]
MNGPSTVSKQHRSRSLNTKRCDAVLLQARNHVLPLMMRLPHLRRRMISRAGRADGGGQISGQQQKSDDVVVATGFIHRKIQGSPNKTRPPFPLPLTSSAFDILRHESRQQRLKLFLFFFSLFSSSP